MWEMMAKSNGLEKPLFQYFKNSRNEKKGLFITGILDNEICIGWSLCHKNDDFDIENGVQIAIDRCYLNDRMEKYIPSMPSIYPSIDIYEIIPFSMHYELFRFLNRVQNYYSKIVNENLNYSNVLNYLINDTMIEEFSIERNLQEILENATKFYLTTK